jgi:hypothetical protein
LFHEKHKSSETNRKNRDSNDEDDDIIMQNSDEEEEGQESPLIDALRDNAKFLSQYLGGAAPPTTLENSFDS